jgi:membrane protease YdiL (CAAX protease family)
MESGPFAANLGSILLVFAGAAAAIAAGTYFLSPHLLFSFVRQRPGFWALVMLLYPVLSVYPQSIIYRAFLMHRYQPLFPSPVTMVLASAAAFSLMHVIFRNPLALSLTLAGGILFAWRYQQTGSLFVSSFEHALYGCFLFTIGLGRYFYARNI